MFISDSKRSENRTDCSSLSYRTPLTTFKTSIETMLFIAFRKERMGKRRVPIDWKGCSDECQIKIRLGDAKRFKGALAYFSCQNGGYPSFFCFVITWEGRTLPTPTNSRGIWSEADSKTDTGKCKFWRELKRRWQTTWNYLFIGDANWSACGHLTRKHGKNGGKVGKDMEICEGLFMARAGLSVREVWRRGQMKNACWFGCGNTWREETASKVTRGSQTEICGR